MRFREKQIQSLRLAMASQSPESLTQDNDIGQFPANVRVRSERWTASVLVFHYRQ